MTFKELIGRADPELHDPGPAPGKRPWRRDEQSVMGEDVSYPSYPDPVTEPLREPEQLERNRLNEIAALVRTLTYGEMIELAGAIWNVKPGEDLTEASLPMTLHLWSADNG